MQGQLRERELAARPGRLAEQAATIQRQATELNKLRAELAAAAEPRARPVSVKIFDADAAEEEDAETLSERVARGEKDRRVTCQVGTQWQYLYACLI